MNMRLAPRSPFLSFTSVAVMLAARSARARRRAARPRVVALQGREAENRWENEGGSAWRKQC